MTKTINRLGLITGLVHVSGNGKATYQVTMKESKEIRHLTKQEMKVLCEFTDGNTLVFV